MPGLHTSSVWPMNSNGNMGQAQRRPDPDGSVKPDLCEEDREQPGPNPAVRGIGERSDSNPVAQGREQCSGLDQSGHWRGAGGWHWGPVQMNPSLQWMDLVLLLLHGNGPGRT